MPSPGIVFASALPCEREVKIAYGLRAHGVPTTLIYVNDPNNFSPPEHFDFTIKCQDANEALLVATRMRPRLLHVFSYGADNVAALLVQNRIAKIVYDYKDCFENVLGWGQHPSYYAVQRICIEQADGLCCRDLQAWNYCRVNGLQPRGKTILFHEYCWGDAARPRRDADDAIHVTLIGNFVVERAYPAYADTGVLAVAEALTSRGVHVHLYPRWHDAGFIRDESAFADYAALATRTPYLHMHAPVPMARVREEIAVYDYGLLPYQGVLAGMPLNTMRNGHEKHIMGSRIFEYVDAGLEVMVSPEFRMMHRVMREAGVAVSFTRGLLDDPLPVLKARRGPAQAARVAAARERLSIKRHIPRLLKFYASL